jgi:hypothetical protein
MDDDVERIDVDRRLEGGRGALGIALLREGVGERDLR